MSFLKNILKPIDEPIKSYNNFWNWFEKKERAFFKVIIENGNIEKYFFDKVSPRLNKIKNGFYYLTGMFNDNTVELVFM